VNLWLLLLLLLLLHVIRNLFMWLLHPVWPTPAALLLAVACQL